MMGKVSARGSIICHTLGLFLRVKRVPKTTTMHPIKIRKVIGIKNDTLNPKLFAAFPGVTSKISLLKKLIVVVSKNMAKTTAANWVVQNIFRPLFCFIVRCRGQCLPNAPSPLPVGGR